MASIKELALIFKANYFKVNLMGSREKKKRNLNIGLKCAIRNKAIHPSDMCCTIRGNNVRPCEKSSGNTLHSRRVFCRYDLCCVTMAKLIS